MTTTNTDIEEGSCFIVIFFLLLPTMICIVKDFSRDFRSYLHPRTVPPSDYKLNLNVNGDSFERESLLGKSKDSDEETMDDDDNNNKLQSNDNNLSKSPITSITLVDSEHRILARTPNHISLDDTQKGVNNKIPELILSLPVIEESINISIKPLELILWLIYLTLSYIALRTMVVSKNMRYNIKYIAADMQDILELSIRGIIVYIFGNIQQRICKKFFLWNAWFIFFYPFVFQICPTTLTIRHSSWNEYIMNWKLISLIIFVGVSNIYIVLDNFYCVWKFKKWWIYGYISFGFVILYHVIFIKSANNDIDIHIHHHHWAFMLALFIHSKKDSSLVMHALLTSIFIHGITVFGCENLFDYKNVDLDKIESIDV
eukprot:417628_1